MTHSSVGPARTCSKAAGERKHCAHSQQPHQRCWQRAPTADHQGLLHLLTLPCAQSPLPTVALIGSGHSTLSTLQPKAALSSHTSMWEPQTTPKVCTYLRSQPREDLTSAGTGLWARRNINSCLRIWS